MLGMDPTTHSASMPVVLLEVFPVESTSRTVVPLDSVMKGTSDPRIVCLMSTFPNAHHESTINHYITTLAYAL